MVILINLEIGIRSTLFLKWKLHESNKELRISLCCYRRDKNYFNPEMKMRKFVLALGGGVSEKPLLAGKFRRKNKSNDFISSFI